eukprot:3925036-Amphidinium_carterae.1
MLCCSIAEFQPTACLCSDPQAKTLLAPPSVRSTLKAPAIVDIIFCSAQKMKKSGHFASGMTADLTLHWRREQQYEVAIKKSCETLSESSIKLCNGMQVDLDLFELLCVTFQPFLERGDQMHRHFGHVRG